MPKVAPGDQPATRADGRDAAVRLASAPRKQGAAWALLGPGSWHDAALAVQASSASYGTPPSLAQTAPPDASAPRKTELKPTSPFPGDDSNLEYADLWAEIRAGGGCKHSVMIDESATDTQVAFAYPNALS